MLTVEHWCCHVYCLQPPIKKFVKGEGGIDQYECAVKYIPGHNPDLVLTDVQTGEQIERLDLTQYKSQEALHEVFTTRNILRKGGDGQDGQTSGDAPKTEL